MKKRFDHIRFAIEEHLSSINENSAEIQSLFDYLNKIDVKLDKMGQRLDELQLNGVRKPLVSPLEENEKKIFLALYTEETPLSYSEISERAGLSPHLVMETASLLLQKGVPLRRSLVNGQVFLQLDSQFKELQAKENLVNLSLSSFM